MHIRARKSLAGEASYQHVEIGNLSSFDTMNVANCDVVANVASIRCSRIRINVISPDDFVTRSYKAQI
jgi:hypothetical protein